jgi:hypothetical protein
MLSLLNKIYKQNDFEINLYKIKENQVLEVEMIEDEIIDEESNFMFSRKKNQEYYITAQYTENEMKNFFDIKKTNDLIELFEKLKGTSEDIQKNTSLIVCVKVEKLQNAHASLKNIVFKIEEDEYFFRKYVIIYTEDSIKNIDSNRNIKVQLHEIIKEDNIMEEYQKNFYFSEEYFLALQFFVKLPFFVFEADTKQFTTLEDELAKVIETNQLNSIDSKILSFEKNFNKANRDDYINELTDAFLSEKKDNNILDTFFNQFEGLQ